jgi:hypothetical protein
MNKYYTIGAVAIAGILLSEFGAWAKITHQSYATNILTTGIILRAIGLAGLVWLLVVYLRKRNR